MTTNTPNVSQAIATAYADIRQAQLRIVALGYAYQDIAREQRYYHGKVKEEYSALHGELYRKLNQAYSNLAMWGCIHPDEDTRKKAARMLWQRYLKEGMEIMGYLQPGLLPPSGYNAEDHDQFREELEHLADLLNIPEEDRER